MITKLRRDVVLARHQLSKHENTCKFSFFRGEMAAMKSSTKLLASAFSTILDTPVLTFDQYVREKKKLDCEFSRFRELTIPEMFRMCNQTGPVGDGCSTSTEDSVLFVDFKGLELAIPFSREESVASLKQKIEQKLPIEDPRVIFAGKQLQEPYRLCDYSIVSNSTLFVLERVTGGGDQQVALVLKDEFLDPRYDFDFRDLKDDGTVFYRGEKRYRRPYGWKRFALRVRGHYEDDVWLGKPGHRTKSSPGEWPVSYHGTSPIDGSSIVKDGHDLSKGKRFSHGKGVYTSPSPTVARRYAQTFEHDGKKYEFLLQTRVSPKDLAVVSASEAGAGEYWVQPHDSLVRPYGILCRRV